MSTIKTKDGTAIYYNDWGTGQRRNSGGAGEHSALDAQRSPRAGAPGVVLK